MANKDSIPSKDELYALLERVDSDDPDPADVKALRKLFSQYPQVWRSVGDMAEQAAKHLVGNAGGTAVVKESIAAGWKGVKRDLEYEHAPALEKLLIEQVGLCWMRHYILEQRFTNVTLAGGTIDALNYWERCLNASQRRYLRACETLARVRKIVRRTPALQINIAAQGGQQVNVAGDVKR